MKNNYEQAILAYTAGLNVSRKLFGPIAIETGFNYSKKGYTFDSSSLTGDFNLHKSFIYNYLQIPARIKLYIRQGKRNFYLTGGVSAMMLFDVLENSIETKNGLPTVSKPKLKEEVIKKFNYNVLFGIGLDYQITKRFYVKIKPSFSKTLDSIKNEKLQTFLYSASVNLGFLYVLRKK